VDQQTNDPNAEARTALARRSTSREPANLIRDLIERQKPEIARALIGTALDPERFARIAFTAIRQSPQLMRCRPESLLGALMTAAQLGLEPGPLGEAWLVPFKDQVTFIVGYRGLLKLAWQSGQLRNISARVVYEADDFDFAFGSRAWSTGRRAGTEAPRSTSTRRPRCSAAASSSRCCRSRRWRRSGAARPPPPRGPGHG
jgi:phage RecT family recombinase